MIAFSILVTALTFVTLYQTCTMFIYNYPRNYWSTFDGFFLVRKLFSILPQYSYKGMTGKINDDAFTHAICSLSVRFVWSQ